MTVEVTNKEFSDALLDPEVRELIVKKISAMKTEGLADSITAQYKSLGIVADEPESAGAADAASAESAEAGATESADAAA